MVDLRYRILIANLSKLEANVKSRNEKIKKCIKTKNETWSVRITQEENNFLIGGYKIFSIAPQRRWGITHMTINGTGALLDEYKQEHKLLITTLTLIRCQIKINYDFYFLELKNMKEEIKY